MVIVLGAVLANAGMLPTRANPTYDAIFTYIAPASLFLLLLDVNLVQLRKTGFPILILFLLGSVWWFVPPVYARLYHADAVLAMDIAKPAESAYAIAAMAVLPASLKGLMGVAIIAATMSTMDTGLNQKAAQIFRIMVPDVCRLMKWKVPQSDRAQLLFGRFATLCLGVGILSVAVSYSTLEDLGLFQLNIILAAFYSGIAAPSVWGLFIRRVPLWTPFLCLGMGVVTGLITAFGSPLFGHEFTLPQKALLNFGLPSVTFFLCMPFYQASPRFFKEKVQTFFAKMHRPVDFQKEIGAPTDVTQLIYIGRFTLAIGGFVFLLAFTCRTLGDAEIVVFLAASVSLLGFALHHAGIRSRRRLKAFTERAASSG